ncbi:PLP-dependent aminotransferase family protein [Actinoplanes sp. LDG1-06]|uniref:PLP-dependent aminotransferase family protein n=1 Tax=Paractinoplanes ovalisporus TaxID=2810368 RepID=A0ABS2AI32_9ACTN|nr:PLP-dependent aminotransferase family protein [Actinoplanes ovalisporus]MBM2619502.1 PLP-dependent aminotransferase family protein [Actinoplanes ovalisporus]
MTAEEKRVVLDAADLHSSLRDPLLDSMNFLNEIVNRYPRAISFAPGRPYLGLFEPSELDRYVGRYTAHLRDDLGFSKEQVHNNLVQYGRTNGHIGHLIARTLANDEDMHVPAESIVVTVGCQEAMILVLRALFASPDDVLLVADPCYVGIGGAARVLDVTMRAVPESEDGLTVASVTAAVAAVRAEGRRPRALYLVPDFANPSGHSLAPDVRESLLELAERENLLIIEDNPYGFFVRQGTARPTMKSMDAGGRVIYLGSFAKTCFPGARLGYVVADQLVAVPDGERVLLADEISKIKSMVTVNTPSLSQAVIGGMLLEHDCRLREANAPSAAFYRDNMNLMLDSLRKSFPADGGTRWNSPDGGFFVVMELPFPADQRALAVSAADFGVLWTPMREFYLDGGGDRAIRLSCSALAPEQIVDGVERLRDFVAAYART